MTNPFINKLNLLNRTVLESLSISSERKIIEKFVEASAKTLGADYAFSWFREEADKDFRWLYKTKSTPYTPTQPRKHGVMSKVFNARQPMLIENVKKAGLVREDAREHMKSVAVIPVVYQKKIYGTLVLCYKQTHRFSEYEHDLCTFIGNSAAQAITINRLNSNLKKAKDTLEEKVKERTHQLSQVNDRLKAEIKQRKQTEAELRASETKFKAFAQNTVDIFNIIQPDGTIVYESPSIKHILGYEPGENVGKNVFELIHPQDLPLIREVFRRGLEDPKRSYRAEFRYRHKDGSWRVIESIGRSFMNDPVINGIIVNSRDVTERYEAQEKLRQSERSLAEAQSIAHLGSWEWDMQSGQISWSKEMGNIYGTPDCTTATYEEFLEHIHPADRKRVNAIIQGALKTHGDFSFIHRIVLPDETEKILSSRGYVITGSEGSVLKIVGTGQDVTEQQLVEQQLKTHAEALEKSRRHIEQEKARLDQLFQSMGEGVVATDSEGRIIAMNPQTMDMLELGPDAIGKSLYEVETLYDAKGKQAQLKDRPIYQALKFGKRVATSGPSNTFHLIRKDGTKLPLGLTAAPIKVGDKIIGAIQIMRDISREAEIDKVKSELISLASHQLRTPLSAINWFSETLLNQEVGKINPQQRKYLQEIFNANQKMVELVYDFLNVSRLELGTFTLKPINLSLKEVADGVIHELQPAIEQKRLKLNVKIGKTPATVYTDRKLVRIIIQNLLSNAVKYTPEKGKVSLSISYRQKSKGKLETDIVVSDTGIGIPKSQQDYIYSKLFRADNIKKLDTEGTGLGLYILKSFVDYCGGKTWFASKENQGTTFYVSLPVEKERKM